MTDTFRAMCAELLAALEGEGYTHWVTPPDEDELCLRARALLAQPEPEGLTDEELDRSERRCWKRGSSIEIEPEGIREVWDRDETFDHRAYARAVIAADRARRPTPQPEPEGLTDKQALDLSEDDIDDLFHIAVAAQAAGTFPSDAMISQLTDNYGWDEDEKRHCLAAARIALAFWGNLTPQPPALDG